MESCSDALGYENPPQTGSVGDDCSEPEMRQACGYERRRQRLAGHQIRKPHPGVDVEPQRTDVQTGGMHLDTRTDSGTDYSPTPVRGCSLARWYHCVLRRIDTRPRYLLSQTAENGTQKCPQATQAWRGYSARVASIRVCGGAGTGHLGNPTHNHVSRLRRGQAVSATSCYEQACTITEVQHVMQVAHPEILGAKFGK